MREIRVLVTLQVDECDPATKIDREIMQEAAVEAVENAVRHAEDNGFSHAHADDLSIGLVDAVAYEDVDEDEDEDIEP
jgi:anti-sigma regulatory factor (Ser/Thr protein kinase)